jgi:glycosyltransferase involved in cell wall biosynthesis
MEFRNKVVMAPKVPAWKQFEDAEVERLSQLFEHKPSATIACVVPTFRRPDGVIASVNSILQQSFQDFVVVVVDDGAGLPILPEDPRVWGVSLSRNSAVLGIVRNVGIRLTQSKYVAFLDDDNTWTPDHLSSALRHLEQGADMVYAGVRRRTPDGAEYDILSRDWDRKAFSDESSFVDANAIVLRRGEDRLFSRLPRVKKTQPKEDWEFVYRVSRGIRVVHSPQPTVEYLVNPDSFYTNWTDHPES